MAEEESLCEEDQPDVCAIDVPELLLDCRCSAYVALELFVHVRLSSVVDLPWLLLSATLFVVDDWRLSLNVCV